MKPFVVIFLVMLLFGLSTWAQSFDAGTFLDSSFNENGTLKLELENQLSFASQQFQALPSPVKAIFGSQRIAVDFTRNDGTVEHLGVVLSNNEVTSFTRFPPANPSMTVHTNEQTAAQIASSENISEAFVQAVNSGNLSYNAVVGGGGEFAVFIANIMVWISTVINAFARAFGF